MWNRFKEHLNKNRLQLNISLIIVAVIYAMVAWHNIDLMTNYALWTNDVNINMICEDCINLREVYDCSMTGCLDFRSIYMRSSTILLFAFFGLVAASIGWVSQCQKKN